MNQTNLALALAKAQSEMMGASKNGYNPHFKSTFSTLDDLIEASRKSLTKHGLAITQYPDSLQEDTYLVTKLKHESGEEEVSRVRIHLKDPTDIQKLGSAISYLKRYVYASICGLAASEGEDDGNSIVASHSSQSFTPTATPPRQSTIASDNKSDSISHKQLGLLKGKLNGNGSLEMAVISKYKLESLAQLPWKHMQDVLKFIESFSAPGPGYTNPADLEEYE